MSQAEMVSQTVNRTTKGIHDRNIKWNSLLGLAATEDNSASRVIDETSNSGGDRKRKRKSRWASSNDGNEKTFIPGMPTILPSNLNPDQQEAYLGNYFHSRPR